MKTSLRIILILFSFAAISACSKPEPFECSEPMVVAFNDAQKAKVQKSIEACAAEKQEYDRTGKNKPRQQ